jgi:uncharacterized membrane protein YeaQ/YmgE (transglycosylase-associated protein family)
LAPPLPFTTIFRGKEQFCEVCLKQVSKRESAEWCAAHAFLPLREIKMPDVYSIFSIVLIGLAAGVLASLVVPTGLDLVGAIVVGVIGAAIGFYLFPALGARVTANPTVASIITSTAGAIILLFVLRLVRR